MARGRHVAVVAVGEFDHEGLRKRAALAELNPGLGEGLAGGRPDADVADFENLHRQLCFGAGPGEALDASGVGEGEDGFVSDTRRGRLGLAGPGEEALVDGAPFHVEFAVAGVEGRGVSPLEGGNGRRDFAGEIVGDELHLLVGRLASARLAEVDVVEVAAGGVRHHSDEGGILCFGAERFFDRLAVIAEVVGRDVGLTDAADVVERVGGKQRNDGTAGFAQDEKGDTGIDRTGRLDEIVGSGTGVHLYFFIAPAERIHRHSALFEKPAAIKNVVGHLDAAEGNFGGTEQIDGATHAVSDAAGDKTLVVREFHVRSIDPWRRAEHGGSGVGVRR